MYTLYVRIQSQNERGKLEGAEKYIWYHLNGQFEAKFQAQTVCLFLTFSMMKYDQFFQPAAKPK